MGKNESLHYKAKRIYTFPTKYTNLPTTGPQLRKCSTF